MARKHTEDEALRSLYKKNDVKINGTSILLLKRKVLNKEETKLIDNPLVKNDVGNGSHGKIDFFVNYCGYTKSLVDRF